MCEFAASRMLLSANQKRLLLSEIYINTACVKTKSTVSSLLFFIVMSLILMEI